MEDLSNNIAFNQIFHTIPEFDEILNNTVRVSNVINDSFEEENKYKYVISDEGKSQLKYCKFQDIDNPINDTCPITQESFSKNDDVIVLPCNHCFTPDAINTWLENESAICPVCRHELQNKEIENPEYNRPRTNNRSRIARRNGFRVAQPPMSLLSNPFNELFQQVERNNNTVFNDTNTYGSRLMREIFSMINEEDDLQQAIEQSLHT